MIKTVLLGILLLLLPHVLPCETNETEPYPIISEINLHRLSAEPTHKVAIHCFDVNAEGEIALGFTEDQFAVYSSEGTFEYAYSFDVYGDYYVTWQEDVLVIGLFRSDKEIGIGPNGEYVFVRDSSGRDASFYEALKSPTRNVGKALYRLHSRTIFPDGYLQLIKETPEETTVLWKADKTVSIRNVMMLTLVVSFIVFVLVRIGVLIKQTHAKSGNPM